MFHQYHNLQSLVLEFAYPGTVLVPPQTFCVPPGAQVPQVEKPWSRRLILLLFFQVKVETRSYSRSLFTSIPMLYQGAIIKLSRGDICVANFTPPAKSASQVNYFLTKMRFCAYIFTIRAVVISNDVAKKKNFVWSLFV